MKDESEEEGYDSPYSDGTVNGSEGDEPPETDLAETDGEDRHPDRRRPRRRGPRPPRRPGRIDRGNPHPGRHGRGRSPEVKVKFPVFKADDSKTAVTYSQWRWEVEAYRLTGCREATLRFKMIQSLQGEPLDVARSAGVAATSQQMLQKLDMMYKSACGPIELKGQLYTAKQYPQEGVNEYSVRLERLVNTLRESYPEEFEGESLDRDHRDCFFNGLRFEFRTMLSHRRKDGTPLGDLVKEAREIETMDLTSKTPKPPASATAATAAAIKAFMYPVNKPRGQATVHSAQVEETDPGAGGDAAEDATPSESADGGDEAGYIVRLQQAMKEFEQRRGCCFRCGSPNHYQAECDQPKRDLNASRGPGKKGTRPSTPIFRMPPSCAPNAPSEAVKAGKAKADSQA